MKHKLGHSWKALVGEVLRKIMGQVNASNPLGQEWRTHQLRSSVLLRVSWAALAGSLVAAFLLLNNGDLNHTVTSSYAYLDGKFLEFYDYNAPLVFRNDYLPLIYVFFAIWMSPLRAMGLTTTPEKWGSTQMEFGNILPLTNLEFLWAKSLLLIVLVLTVCAFWKLAVSVGKKLGIPRASSSIFLFATSPFLLFPIFVMGQYDIFGILFFILGLSQLFNGNRFFFSILVGVAMSFKFIAIVPFVILILVFEKNLLRLASYLLVSLVPVGIQMAVYAQSEVFLKSIFFQPSSNASVFGTKLGIPMIIAYAIVAAVAYFQKQETLAKRISASIAYGGLGLSFFFTAIYWHPQWLAWLSPFLALAVFVLPNLRAIITYELLAFVVFCIYVPSEFSGGVDTNMLSHGVMKTSFRESLPHMGELFVIGTTTGFLVLQKLMTLGLPYLYLAQRIFNFSKQDQEFSVNQWGSFIRNLLLPIWVLVLTLTALLR